jgi:isopenicillin N synthase-like dioxygenase
LTSDEKWAPVPVYPGDRTDFPYPPILVNIGDMLSYWTDGLLKSTVHRVVFPHDKQSSAASIPRDRYSIAFFCQPVGSTELIPVPSKVVTAYRQKKQDSNANTVVGYGGGASGLNVDQRRLTAGEHLQSRLAATYITPK